jgi:hypothetical protein
VPSLFGYVEEHHDYKGVFTSVFVQIALSQPLEVATKNAQPVRKS